MGKIAERFAGRAAERREQALAIQQLVSVSVAIGFLRSQRAGKNNSALIDSPRYRIPHFAQCRAEDCGRTDVPGHSVLCSGGSMTSTRLVVLVAFLLFGHTDTLGQPASVRVIGDYDVERDVTYMRLGVWEGKLDIYSRREPAGPHPTFVYFHSGGALGSGGRRNAVTLDLLPYLEWGWNVVNVDYNLPGLTLAPVAVQNALCAVRWVFANGSKYGIDTSRVVTSGWSSGGWVALMSAMAPDTSDWDRPCAKPADGRVVAVINRAGVSDFAAALTGPEAKPWAKFWFQTLPNPSDIARSVSPVTLVRTGMPPVISIHGDADQVVPYSQSVQLHAALKKAGVQEQLFTVSGGEHGISPSSHVKALQEVANFLSRQGLPLKQ